MLILLNNNNLIADKCHVAKSFISRLRGLLGKTQLKEGEALWLSKCNSIHMWFMQISIDVVFVRPQDKGWIVSSVYSNVKPWKLFPLSDWRATDTVELMQGSIQKWNIRVGDTLCLN